MAQPGPNADWLLLETFSASSSATVIAQGVTTKAFLPLDKIIKSTTHRRIVETAIESIREDPFPRDFILGDNRYIFRPLQDYEAALAGILFHYGPVTEPVTDPPDCGAWSFDLDQGLAIGSDAMHDLHRVPKSDRFISKPIHESLSRIVGPDPAATAKLIHKQPGETHQATETITSEDGSLWTAAYSAGFVLQPDGSIRVQGITRRIGDYQPRPMPADLSDQVVRAVSQPGLFRVVIDPTQGTFLRSYDPPLMPGARDVTQIVTDSDDASTLLRLIHNCAVDNVAITSISMRGLANDVLRIDLFPLDVDGIRAVLVTIKHTHFG